MALALDTTSSTSSSTNDTAYSHTHTCTGSNLALFVLLHGIRTDEANFTYDTVTYNSVAMTPIASATTTTTSRGYRTSIYRLIAPATDSNTIDIVTSNTIQGIVIGAFSFTGADQTNPDGITGTNDAGTEVTVTTTVAGSILITACSVRSNTTAPTFTASGSNSEKYDVFSAEAQTEVVGAGYTLSTPTVGSYTGGGTTGSAVGDIAAAVEVLPVAGGATALADIIRSSPSVIPVDRTFEGGGGPIT